ncbi:hypothetical protein OG968_25235 [Streptomyces althioticus]|uniref:hypothetical protein n=1 Tax=Streptomyces althioticus TaxID=83380 RepID=UPI003873B3BB|nr:hypothetical protein OG968_25235 [Streptomyces althioticus]
MTKDIEAPPQLPLGRIRLHWEPASHAGWDVTAHLGLATTEAHLGLATTEALLASWPAAPTTGRAWSTPLSTR